MTHYVPYFAEHRWRHAIAVCGRTIFMKDHTPEPTCPKCREWLEADAAEGKELAAKWDAEDAAKRAAGASK